MQGFLSYPVSGVPCVPIIAELHFFEASTDSDEQLFDLIGYQKRNTSEFLTDIVIPNLKTQPDWLLYPLIEFILDKVPIAGKPHLIHFLSEVPFVRVCDKNGREALTRVKPSEVIDRSSVLSDLYFHNEQVFGSGAYSSDGPHHQSLSILGMISRFDATIATERIQHYHRYDENDNEVSKKSRLLLTHLNDVEFDDEWLPFMRIPAFNCDGAPNQPVVLHPSMCRPKVYEPLVGGVLGIVQIHIEEFLCTKFGWNDDIEPRIISDRINHIIQSARSSSDVQLDLYPVLDYLNTTTSNKDIISDYVTEGKGIRSQKAWLYGSGEGL